MWVFFKNSKVQMQKMVFDSNYWEYTKINKTYSTQEKR